MKTGRFLTGALLHEISAIDRRRARIHYAELCTLWRSPSSTNRIAVKTGSLSRILQGRKWAAWLAICICRPDSTASGMRKPGPALPGRFCRGKSAARVSARNPQVCLPAAPAVLRHLRAQVVDESAYVNRGAVTVSVPCTLSPAALAVICSVTSAVLAVRATVVTWKLWLFCPAAMVTEAGADPILASDEVRVTTNPPAGAGALRVMVAVLGWPPKTEVGANFNPANPSF